MVKKVKMVLSVVLLLSFFLPWFAVDLFFVDVKVSGFNLVELLTSEFAMWLDSASVIFYVLYLIPIFAIISLLKASSRAWSFVTGIFTFLICLIGATVANDAPILEFLAIGGYLTILSSLGLIITSFFKVEKNQRVTLGSQINS